MTDLDRVFQAPADHGRRLMIDRLSQGSASVSELGKPLAMSLVAVVQHVQVLEASGLACGSAVLTASATIWPTRADSPPRGSPENHGQIPEEKQ